MIIVPIVIAWFQIHVSSSSTKGLQTNFQTITEVRPLRLLLLLLLICENNSGMRMEIKRNGIEMKQRVAKEWTKNERKIQSTAMNTKCR